jgi:dihydrofolate reductase
VGATVWQQADVRVHTSRDIPIPQGADVRLVSGSVADAFQAIEAAAADGDIWVVGGGELAGQFPDAGLLDVIAVSVAPVALTGGAILAAASAGVRSPAPGIGERGGAVRAAGV